MSPYETLIASQSLFDLYDSMVGEDVDLPSVLRHVADVVSVTVQAERASVYLIDNDTRELESVAVVGNIARTIRVPMSEESMAGYCACTGRAFLVPDAYGDLSGIDPGLRFDSSWDEVNRFRTRDVMCAPALFKGTVMGVVQVINGRKRPFRCDDLEPLQSISRLIGYALYHSKLYNDLATFKQLDREKAEFMRILVHELKSPVAAAKSSLDVITAGYVTDPQDISGFCEKAGRRMTQVGDMIGDILSLAKVKAGGSLGEVCVFDVVPRIRREVEAYREQAAEKGISFTADMPAVPLMIRFDEQGLQLVVSNLVSNALKYTKRGSVGVRVYSERGYAVLAVHDSGIGIPEADVPRLFKEFFRASNARRSGIEGSGVGLAGVKNIVERFGGEMHLESREGQGSTFSVLIPLFSQ